MRAGAEKKKMKPNVIAQGCRFHHEKGEHRDLVKFLAVIQAVLNDLLQSRTILASICSPMMGTLVFSGPCSPFRNHGD